MKKTQKAVNNSELTPWQVLTIKGAFFYFIILLVAAPVASIFQLLAGVKIHLALVTIVVNSVGVFLGYIIYRKRKNLKETKILPWVVSTYTILMVTSVRYNYAFNIDWFYAANSYHISAISLFVVVILQFFYNKKLYIVFTTLVFVHWAFFIYLCRMHGVEMGGTFVNGQVNHGIVLYRELYYFIIMLMIAYSCYRNISIARDYDIKTTKQRLKIEDQIKVNLLLSTDIKDRVGSLFNQVEEQNSVIDQFNDKIQSQAATFEELSSILEELLGSSENISDNSTEQIGETVKLESILDEFKEIKIETKKHLAASMDNIDSIVSSTNTGKDKIKEVENTISQISEHGKSILETISIIVDIADKINLLSLNASIEAARAGDYGKGFAVVADEIGKLATQTSDSINEIERVLSSNKEATEQGVEVIHSMAKIFIDMIQKIDNSSSKIRYLQDSLLIEEKHIDQIISQSTSNIKLAKNIGTGTEEQKTAIASSTEAVNHLNEMIAEMLEGINGISKASKDIFTNARVILEKSEKLAQSD